MKMSKTETCKVCGQEYDPSDRALFIINGETHAIENIEVSGVNINGLCKGCLRAAAYGSLATKYYEIPEVEEVGEDRAVVLSRAGSDEENGDKGVFKNVWCR